MRYLSIFRAVETDAPPSQAEVQAMGEFIAELSAAGKLIATEGCLPSARGVRVRQLSGRRSVTDGPFTEAKEVIGGFALLNVASKEEAIDIAYRFMDLAGDGECEIRELYDEPALAPS